jgi:hypothetical protein
VVGEGERGRHNAGVSQVPGRDLVGDNEQVTYGAEREERNCDNSVMSKLSAEDDRRQ